MTDLPTSVLGRTGLTVTKLAYGAMELRGNRAGGVGREVTDDQAGVILNAVLDSGINLIDTSPDYGPSEEMIGRHISARRDEFILTSKCGCPVSADGEEVPAHAAHVFTRANVRAGVEQSLRRMKTDRIDVVQFHISPSRAELEANDSVEELRTLQKEGKVRFIGMSGTPPHLADQIAWGVFDVFQIPYSALERDNEAAISAAAASGAGTLIRGGVSKGIASGGEAVLNRIPERGRANFAGRLDLWNAAGLDDILDGLTRQEFMLRFTLSHPGMTTTIVGTANPDHLAANVATAKQGPLPADQLVAAKHRLDAAVAAG